MFSSLSDGQGRAAAADETIRTEGYNIGTAWRARKPPAREIPKERQRQMAVACPE